MVWLLGKSSGGCFVCSVCTAPAAQSVTEEELKALLVEGAQTGVLEIEERDMIERVLRLADKPVRAIMTPRTELAWIDRTHPAEGHRGRAEGRAAFAHRGLRQVDRQRGRHRPGEGPAGSDPERRRPVGRRRLRQPIIVPDTVTALDALERLKSDPLGLALVMDEYGSFEGVVTAADMLEAIVGDPAGPEHQDGVPGPEGESSMMLTA